MCLPKKEVRFPVLSTVKGNPNARPAFEYKKSTRGESQVFLK